jgi:outer membrane protein assembly factor BamA
MMLSFGITKRLFTILVIAIGALLFVIAPCDAQADLNGKNISAISIEFPTGGKSTSDEEEFRSIAANTTGATYSTVRIRDSIEALHRTGRIVSVDVEAQETPAGVDLRYLIKRKVQAQKVAIEIQNDLGEPVTE